MESIKIKNFQEFINENYDKFDLSETIQRFYMLVNKKAMQETENPLGVMIRDVRDMLFDQQEVSLANYKSLPIQPRIPIINFTPDADIVRKMIEEKIIDEDVLYNKPVQTELVSDKVIFHQVFNGSKYIPKTVFSVEEAETLNFPIVAKPKSGKSAEGIQKFDTIDELKSSPEKFDLFCEAIDIKFEFRCFCFREDMLEINERIELKGEGDFLKDVKTKTAFYYKKLNIEKFKHLQKLRDLVDECRKFIDLDFFSIDFAMDDSGDMYLIEMNARTGMGVDKMIELYTILHKDFYKNNINTIAETKFDELSGIWKERYEEEKGIDECLTVAGKIDKSMFLFKNRDRSYLPDNKVVVEKVGNTEIAFYTDETNWIEGMNEHGVGFVFSMLSTKEHPGYGPSWYVTDKPKRKGLFEKFKEGVKKILSAKNVEDAIKLLEKSKKSGSFLIGDMKHIYEVEVFKGKLEKRLLEFTKEKPYYVKTNHGELIPEAGHQQNGYSIKRAISTIRQKQGEQLLMGISSVDEVQPRMKQQVFDPSSPLNIFRMDDEEKTISQCLMNLTKLEFTFFHDDRTAKSLVFDKQIKEPKIKVNLVRHGA